MFVIVSKSCDSCGQSAVKVVSQKPTWESAVYEVWQLIGGSSCGWEEVFECELDGEASDEDIGYEYETKDSARH